MTPLTTNPTVVLLVKKGQVVASASNIDLNLNVVVVDEGNAFFLAALGMPFNSTLPVQEEQVMSSKASKARHADTFNARRHAEFLAGKIGNEQGGLSTGEQPPVA